MFKSKLKNIIFLFLIIVLLFSCSAHKEDEVEIEDVVMSFYDNLNKGDYKQTESLFSENMRQDVKKIKDDFQMFVKYKKVNVKEIEINGLNAIIIAECTDVFSNTTTMSWDLIKQNDHWKINNFNFSKAQSVTNEGSGNFVNPPTDINSNISDSIDNVSISSETNTDKLK